MPRAVQGVRTRIDATSPSIHVEEVHVESTSSTKSTQWIETIGFGCMYRRIIKLQATCNEISKIEVSRMDQNNQIQVYV